jgi:small-conductance mechanosensitive channel
MYRTDKTCRRRRSPDTFRTSTLRLSLIGAVMVACALTSLSQNSLPDLVDSNGVIEYINQSINWYRQFVVEQQIADEPSDALILSDNRQIADQAIRLAFDYGRAEAAALAKQGTVTPSDTQNSAAARFQSLTQLSAKLDAQAKELEGELDSLRQKLQTATGKNRQLVKNDLEETQSELQLVEVRRDVIRSMLEFVSGASASGVGASGLRGQIEALARSVPAANSVQANDQNNGTGTHAATPATAVSVAPGNKSEPSGIWGLAADLFSLSRKIRGIDDRIRATDQLSDAAKKLRSPVIADLRELTKRSDEIANQADTSNDPQQFLQQKQQLDALTAQFKQISATMLPLSKQNILLGLYRANLANWQGNFKSRYRSELRGLVFRLAVLAIVLAVVYGFAEVWRRTIFKYVHDPRRRYQFLLLRKIILWFVIIIVIAFAFASQLGSVATFAGLITAGVAVALQNVILSIAGYFFLIGRFGIRVGDRVQVAGVTGEVVDVGLVRLHLMELVGGGETPTGRVVAFSNSIVFQPTAGLFKQIPGTSFVWHEITLTLAPQSDYHAVEERLMGVVESTFKEYQGEMERQRAHMERIVSSGSVASLKPRGRLRFTGTGLEVSIKFPVSLQNAAEIDDRVTRELLQAINREPKLKLADSSAPVIRLSTDSVSAES